MDNGTVFPITSTTPFIPEPDLHVVHTPTGTRIPAHATVLASASPVLANIITSNRTVKIRGVPNGAVTAFVEFLYSFRCTEEDMYKFGMHLLALSHVYSVTRLKQRCIKGIGERVSTENVVDVLQLARLCDAPDLYLKSVKFLVSNLKLVKETEGWKFLQKHDPLLELDILNLMDEQESRKRKARRRKEEERVYVRLSEAMECLEHICTEGCRHVGPYDVETKEEKRECSKFGTCEGVQVLIGHFGSCKKRVNGGCLRCKRMWQLFRLHSSICLTQHSCRVPLCREIQLKMQQENRKDDPMWNLLVRKVASAKAMCSLALPLRKMDEEIRA
ncbi:hypothetical protein RJT34_13061 [Clitoria ternatea]|uniref:BTB domain-containing protein n=1 Tax=Clitoria ternatea TaxID=43366 RepID=A0AAN9PLH5_CLITE